MKKYRAYNAYRTQETASAYERDRFRSFKGRYVHKKEVSLVLRALRLIPRGDTVIDIPCGTSRLSPYLSKTDYKVFGVDISEKMLGMAKQMGRPEFGVCADAEKLPFKNEQFDCVISLRFFGHLPPVRAEAVLKELVRVSRRYLIIAHYNSTSLRGYLRRIKKALSRSKEPWFSTPLPKILKLFRSAELEVKRQYPLNRFLSETCIFLLEK